VCPLALARRWYPNPARLPNRNVFYGWIVVAVMATVSALAMALGSLNFGLFIKPMGDELGVGRAVFGWAQSAVQFANALFAPTVGRLIDRFGVRYLLAAAALLTAAALIGLSFATEGWQVVAAFALVGVAGVSGGGSLLTSVPVTKWFVRERGRALAFLALGGPVGGLVFVPVTQLLIDGIGWRGAWVVLALVGAGLIVPLSIAFVRRQPEDLGLQPDGARAPSGPAAESAADLAAAEAPAPPAAEAAASAAAARAVAEPADERSWTRAEALRSPTFWRLIAAFGLLALGTGSVALHRIPSFMDRGLDPRLISYATALDAGAAGLAGFTVGVLTRRFPARFLGAAGFLTLAAASVLTILTDDHPMMFASMILFGLGIGSSFLMQSYVWAAYFGRVHLGAIRGAVLPLTLVFGGAGAPLAGYVRDATGSYLPAWIAAVLLMVVAASVLALTPPPRAEG
jgi:MFS family permease